MAVVIVLPLPGNAQRQNQWDWVLCHFCPDVLYVIGDVDDAPSTNIMADLNAIYIGGLSEITEDYPLVVAAQADGRWVQGDTNLRDFVHPEDAIYYFGHDTHWVAEEMFDGRPVASRVYVPTDTQYDMWSYVAFATFMWDRRSKQGG